MDGALTFFAVGGNYDADAGSVHVCVVGSSSKIDLLHKEGYDKVIVRSKDFRADLKAALADRDLNIILEMEIQTVTTELARITSKPSSFDLSLAESIATLFTAEKMTDVTLEVLGHLITWTFD